MRPMHRRDDQLSACMRNALAARNLPDTEGLGYVCVVRASGANMKQSKGADRPKRLYLQRVEVRVIGNTSTPIGPPRPDGAYRASWPGKQDCGAGIPMQAQDRPGPVCKGRQPWRATARDSWRRRDGSSLFLLPWRFQEPAADSRCNSHFCDSELLPTVVLDTSSIRTSEATVSR